MTFTRSSLRLLPEEYESFLGVIKNDPRLPGSYEEWITHALKQDRYCIASGDSIVEVVVRFKEFAAYCVEAAPCYDMLLALTKAKAAGLKR